MCEDGATIRFTLHFESHLDTSPKWLALGCFMDIEGAFNNTGLEITRRTLEERGFGGGQVSYQYAQE